MSSLALSALSYSGFLFSPEKEESFIEKLEISMSTACGSW